MPTFMRHMKPRREPMCSRIEAGERETEHKALQISTGNLLTLMPFLFHRSRFEVKDTALILLLLRAQLLADLLDVFRVNAVVNARTVPIVLGEIQDGCHGVGHVNDATRVTGDDKEETIGRLEY